MAIKKFKGLQPTRMYNGTGMELPKGGYVCKILSATVKDRPDGSQYYQLGIDIAEGEHKDFYMNKWKADTRPDRKWSCFMFLNIPDDRPTNTEQEQRRQQLNLRLFNDFIWCVEESNSGFHYDIDAEECIKGKLIGLYFIEEDREYNGRIYTNTKPYKAWPVQEIRDGKFTPSEDRKMKPTVTQPSISGPDFNVAIDSDTEVPFD